MHLLLSGAGIYLAHLCFCTLEAEGSIECIYMAVPQVYGVSMHKLELTTSSALSNGTKWLGAHEMSELSDWLI